MLEKHFFGGFAQICRRGEISNETSLVVVDPPGSLSLVFSLLDKCNAGKIPCARSMSVTCLRSGHPNSIMHSEALMFYVENTRGCGFDSPASSVEHADRHFLEETDPPRDPPQHFPDPITLEHFVRPYEGLLPSTHTPIESLSTDVHEHPTHTLVVFASSPNVDAGGSSQSKVPAGRVEEQRRCNDHNDHFKFILEGGGSFE